MFPTVPAQDILGYSKEQYKWATSHESAVWHKLIEKNMVYNNSEDVIRRMMDETPFTRDFGNDSPGRLGVFLGFQIVQSYMKTHPGTTMKDLLKMTDSQKFLKESGYKPSWEVRSKREEGSDEQQLLCLLIPKVSGFKFQVQSLKS